MKILLIMRCTTLSMIVLSRNLDFGIIIANTYASIESSICKQIFLGRNLAYLVNEIVLLCYAVC